MDETKAIERRYKLVYVPHAFIMSFLTFNERDCIIRPIVEDLPKEGCEVRTVSYSPVRDAFGFIIYHPSFDPVPLGGECPKIILTEIIFQKIQNYDRCGTK